MLQEFQHDQMWRSHLIASELRLTEGRLRIWPKKKSILFHGRRELKEKDFFHLRLCNISESHPTELKSKKLVLAHTQ